jgi:hypothetical protein
MQGVSIFIDLSFNPSQHGGLANNLKLCWRLLAQ